MSVTGVLAYLLQMLAIEDRLMLDLMTLLNTYKKDCSSGGAISALTKAKMVHFQEMLGTYQSMIPNPEWFADILDSLSCNGLDEIISAVQQALLSRSKLRELSDEGYNLIDNPEAKAYIDNMVKKPETTKDDLSDIPGKPVWYMRLRIIMSTDFQLIHIHGISS